MDNKFQQIKKYLQDGGFILIAGTDVKGRIAETFISAALTQKQVVDFEVKKKINKIPKLIRWIWKIK